MPQHAVARRTVDVQPPRLMTSANPVLFAFLGVSCHAFSHSSLMPPPPLLSSLRWGQLPSAFVPHPATTCLLFQQSCVPSSTHLEPLST